MVLHLGGDVVIPTKDIIAIFDLASIKISDINKEFLEIAEDEGFIQSVSDEEPKSFILVESGNKTMMYMSPIASSTLLKRSRSIEDISSAEKGHE